VLGTFQDQASRSSCKCILTDSAAHEYLLRTVAIRDRPSLMVVKFTMSFSRMGCAEMSRLKAGPFLSGDQLEVEERLLQLRRLKENKVLLTWS
jgi:hypothetical protein